MIQPIIDAAGRALQPGRFPPSSRFGLRKLFGTRGVPSALIGNDGDLATDPTTGKVYVKTGDVWQYKTQGFDRLFAPASSQEVSTTDGDPVVVASSLVSMDSGSTFIPTQDQSYSLSIASAGFLADGVTWNTVLNWTFPDVIAQIEAGRTGPANASRTALWLQKSIAHINSPNVGSPVPNPPVYAYQPSFSGYNTRPATPPTTPDWTTVQSWGNNGNGVDFTPIASMPTSFTDTAVPDHILNYRLVMELEYQGMAPTQFAIDWNIVTVTKHYNVTVNQQADGAHISWA